jgi:hypothetical protein
MYLHRVQLLRQVVGQHTLDETLSETDRINLDLREILDVSTVDWGVEVALMERPLACPADNRPEAAR